MAEVVVDPTPRARLDALRAYLDYVVSLGEAPQVSFSIEIQRGWSYTADLYVGPGYDSPLDAYTTDLNADPNAYVQTKVTGGPGRVEGGATYGLYLGETVVVYVRVGSRRGTPDDWVDSPGRPDHRHVVVDLTVYLDGQEAVFDG